MTGGTQSLVQNDFVIKLTKRKVGGSQATARTTAALLRSVISKQKVPHTNQSAILIEAIRSVGEQLINANPTELVVGNIVRRVLHIIRKEDVSVVANAAGGLRLSVSGDCKDTVEDENCSFPSAAVTAAAAARSLLHPPSLLSLLDCKPDSTIAHHPSGIGDGSEVEDNIRSEKSWKLKHEVMLTVNELIEDINNCHEQIAEQAVELIHHNEVILTLGHSTTVMEFLSAAKEKKRSFRVFVTEGAPMSVLCLARVLQLKYQGQLLAKNLVAKGFQTTVITDSAVFAMISRVNMVLVGVHAVMANGGVIGNIGMHMVALAAKKHAVPFVVLAGTHKLCPLYPDNPEVVLNEMRSPSELLDFGEHSDLMDYRIGSGAPLLHVANPAFDYVPPELVSLLITEIGGHSPSFMYRLIADCYSADDLVLKKQSSC